MAGDDGEIAEITMIEDPCLAWICSHPERLARFVGRYVLVQAGRGVVADAEDPAQLEALGRALEGPEDGLLVHYVRPGMHAPVAA